MAKEEITKKDKKRLLAGAITNGVAMGYRIERQTDDQAVLAKGQRINHVLHLILTILTGGLWGIVWIILAVNGAEKRVVLTVDDYGNVLRQET